MIWVKSFHLIPKITFFILQYWLKSRNETLKQRLILAIANTVLILTVSVPHMANAMPIHMVKTTLYQIIIQFYEKTIQLMWVTYTTKVFNQY